MIRAVRHELRIEEVHEAVWPVVDREAEDAHVVGVEDPVSEPDALPLRYYLRCAADDLFKPGPDARVRVSLSVLKVFRVDGMPAHEERGGLAVTSVMILIWCPCSHCF